MSGFLLGLLVGWAIVATVAAWYGLSTLRRVYRYAVRHADRLDVMDPAGCAYSDIATVIALDGRCEDRIPAPSGAEPPTPGALDLTGLRPNESTYRPIPNPRDVDLRRSASNVSKMVDPYKRAAEIRASRLEGPK